MSVINETLENLKQTKKRSSGSLHPASSAHCEKAEKYEKNAVAKKTYMISIGVVMLAGVFFYFSQIFYPKMMQYRQYFTQSNTENQQQVPHHLVGRGTNSSVQKMYYHAMALLNEGNEEQAALKLQDIIAQYPDFIPAKQAYSMIAVR